MIGSMVSHYRILDKLGSGGMGVVYRAEDTLLKRPVALKFLPLILGTDPESRERFTHEAQAASALDHPNICTIHEIGSTDRGELFICMNYYEGESLRQKIEHGPMATAEAIDIAIQIARGLAKAHDHGILHRDVKPANVMITNEGVAKIVDFGLAKLSGATKVTRTGSTLGTVMYMSPEQARGDDTDQRTDLWSLGVVLYEILTGHTPFRGEHEAAIMYSILNEEPEGLRKGIPGIGPELETILARALEKDRKARYQSAHEMIADLERLTLPHRAVPALNARVILRTMRKPRIMVPLLLLLAAIIAGSLWMIQRQAKIRWARSILQEIDQLIATGGMESGIFFPRAYALTTEAQKIIPDDPNLLALLPRCTSRLTVISDPPGARIFQKALSASDSAWEYLGLTPGDSLQVPMGVLAYKLTKDGYDTLLATTWTFSLYGSEKPVPRIGTIEKKLDKRGTVPEGMVHISGRQTEDYGFIDDFYVDRYEITNKSYKDFVDNGGYLRQEFWTEPFERNGKVVSLQEAMKEFVDQTGRPGPSTWTAGSFPEGQDYYPVSGVSWYEAAAYAEYVHKSLPTWWHWNRASGFYPSWGKGVAPVILGQCNFGGKGPVAVGTGKGLTPSGVFDIAGNVREWCWNEMPGGRLIRGGAWNDAVYQSENWSQASAFDRSSKNGFRCVVYPNPEKVPAKLLMKEGLESTSPDFYMMKPVPDRVFEVYLEQYAYDRTPLNARQELRNDDAKDWIQEKIMFDAAYGGERVAVYLFLPRNAKPPFQTVIYFPGSASVENTSSKDLDKYIEFKSNLYFFLQAGRAVLYPVYKGTFERGDSVITGGWAVGNDSRRFTEYFIQVVKDFRRSIDYLETRTDIDTGKIAYCGFSWGGLWSAVIPAIEPRLKCSIVMLGGLWGFGRPEVNPINYISRVQIPTLILSGKYDIVFRMEENVKPLYDLLGTPKQHKVLKVFESDHFIPTNDLIRESLGWLDKYFGPPLR
jgi:eukaryotic-like serine/threonine-protein kinase